MLVPDEGSRIGTVSGGCLEDDVSRIARRVISENRPRAARFNLKSRG
jgi:xanthine/CO dehydrogenase XdhC/CoxF family maturation factor